MTASVLTHTRQAFEMVKFSHSVFALPYALSSLLLASGGRPSLKQIVLIILCMVTARNTAMAFNRLVDADIDAKNPRTKDRHIPKGLLSRRFAIGFITVNAVLFIAFAAGLNILTGLLALPTLVVLCSYSYAKRFTDYTQLYLGVCLGLSPIGAWIAITGEIALLPVLMALGVMFWVAGFDLLYAMQDHAFDTKAGVKSMVVKWGIPKALILSRIFHAACIVLLALAGWTGHLGLFYAVAIAAIAILLAYEQSLIRADDLSRMDAAFFTVNGVIGLIYLAGVAAHVWIIL
jgi:4-hydroxybenzoate polyprenyltransferase